MLEVLSEKRHVVETLKVCLFVPFKSCALPEMNVRVQIGRVFELESTEILLKACNDSSTLQTLLGNCTL